jgi:outer membrane protein
MRTKSVMLALLTLAASLVAACGAAHAQAKIGVVNVARLLQEAPQAQAASQALETEFASTQARSAGAWSATSRHARSRLQKDGATMAEAERRNQEKALRDGQRDFARKQNEFIEDLNVRRNEALGQLQRSVLQEVQNYAKSARPRRRRRRRALCQQHRSTSPQQVLSSLQAKGRTAAPAKP